MAGLPGPSYHESFRRPGHAGRQLRRRPYGWNKCYDHRQWFGRIYRGPEQYHKGLDGSRGLAVFNNTALYHAERRFKPIIARDYLF